MRKKNKRYQKSFLEKYQDIIFINNDSPVAAPEEKVNELLGKELMKLSEMAIKNKPLTFNE